jgi:hypothetical protein
MEKEMGFKDFSVFFVKKDFKTQDKEIVYIPKSGTTTSLENKKSNLISGIKMI